jgi:excisionase family DNA binding protein
MLEMRAMASEAIRIGVLDHLPFMKESEPMEVVFVGVEKAPPRLLDLTAAAAYLGISRSAIRQLVESGQLPRVRLPSLSQSHGRLDRFLLDKADLDGVIERGKERQEF